MKKIVDKTLSSKYLVYKQNTDKCEPEHLFLSDVDTARSWVPDISDADQWDTLEEAVSAMTYMSEGSSSVSPTIYTPEVIPAEDMAIVFLSADMTTVDETEYTDMYIEAKRQIIFERMPTEDLKFLADHGLGG